MEVPERAAEAGTGLNEWINKLRTVGREVEQAVRQAATICPRPLQADLWHFDLESDVRVTCDVGYLCAILVFLASSLFSS